MNPTERVVLALDLADGDLALELAHRTRELVGMVKVGLPLIMGAGLGAIDQLRRDGHVVFLDLRFDDAPELVEAAVRASHRRCVRWTSVNAMGGPKVIGAALRALTDTTVIPGEPLPGVVAAACPEHVDTQVGEALGFADLEPVAVKLAELAVDAGVDTVLCAARHAKAVRTAVAGRVQLICDGVALKRDLADADPRTVSVGSAIRAGADRVIVGRPVRYAADPIEWLQATLEEIEQAAAAQPQ